MIELEKTRDEISKQAYQKVTSKWQIFNNIPNLKNQVRLEDEDY